VRERETLFCDATAVFFFLSTTTTTTADKKYIYRNQYNLNKVYSKGGGGERAHIFIHMLLAKKHEDASVNHAFYMWPDCI